MNEQIEIRDTRNGEWSWVYNAVIADPHLTIADKIVYSAITTFGGYVKISPTVQQICERSSLSERQIRRSIENLEKKDYIKVEKGTGRGNSNVYYLLKRPKGCQLCTLSQRVPNTTLKGANNAPTTSIDKIDISDPPSAVSHISSFTEEDSSPKYEAVDDDNFPLNRKEKKPSQNKAYEEALTYLAKRRSDLIGEDFKFAGSRIGDYAALKAIKKLMSNKRAYEIWEEMCESEWWQEHGFGLWDIIKQFKKKGK